MAGVTQEFGLSLAREVFEVIDAGDLARTAALLDDSFQLHYHGVPDAIPRATWK